MMDATIPPDLESKMQWIDAALPPLPFDSIYAIIQTGIQGGRTMRTWEDYKNHVKAVSEEERRNMEEIEEVSDIVSSIIRRRQELGISQRTLAERCGIPQSSVARIETLKTTPKLDTLVKLLQALNLKLQVAAAS